MNENINGRVAAAAKLVLQDLDPDARSRRQDFMCASPTAQLNFHFKKLKNFNKVFFKTSTFSDMASLMLYIKVSVQEQQKSTKSSEVCRERKNVAEKSRRQTIKTGTSKDTDAPSIMNGNAEVIIDQVKGFAIDINRHKESPDNIIHFELLNAEKRKEIESIAENAVNRSLGLATTDTKKSTIIGTHDLHLWEVKKESRSEKLLSIKFKDQKVCDLELEVICLYGRLGYGYSHQVPSLSDRSTFQNVEESNFFRLPGIDERKGQDEILLPVHIGYPDMLKIRDPTSIGNQNLRTQLWNLSEDSACFLSQNTKDCTTLSVLMDRRGRLQKLRKEYDKNPHRHERLKFLRDALDKKDRSKPSDSLKGTAVLNDVEKRKSNVRNMIDMVEMSGGITSRRTETKTSDRDVGKQFDFARECEMQSCLNVEVDGRRASTLSNFGGATGHVSSQMINTVPHISYDHSDETLHEEDAEKRESNFLSLAGAAKMARKSIGIFLMKKDEDDEEDE